MFATKTKITAVHMALTVGEELMVYINTKSLYGKRYCIEIKLGMLSDNGQVYSEREGVENLIMMMREYNVHNIKHLVGKKIRLSVQSGRVEFFKTARANKWIRIK